MTGKFIPNIRKSSKLVWAVRVICVLLIVLNFMFIWNNSAKVSKDSDKSSKKIASDVAPVVVEDYEKLPKLDQKKHVNIINSKVRSLAHVAEFMPLGFLLVIVALFLFDLKEKNPWRVVLTCLGFAVTVTLLVALSDELHQLSVKGRTFQFGDIVSDTFGSFIGCLLALIPTYFLKKHNKI